MVITLLFTLTAMASESCLLRGELENDFMREPLASSHRINNQRDFMKMAGRIQKEYGPDFYRRGQSLKVVTDWKTDEENAYATQEGKVAKIHLLGGYARLLHEDAFLMVACHELGHHLAGAPYYSFSQGPFRISIEGQADYFATSKCMRRLLKFEDNRAHIKRYGSHSSVRIDCNHVWGVNTPDSFLCMRSIMAAMNLRLRHLPYARDRLNLRDYTKVELTYERHPQAQCRFDTHRAGALCPVSENLNQSNCLSNRVRQGAGVRPACWFLN
ncbi:MAG: ImmA/IrrE family metallo-endopeptidase [Bdellovibrionales bacterium]